jgi:hypothetical protein
MDTTLDRRDGSLNPDDDGEGGMNGQLGTGQGKKHICPSCLKRFYRPSSLMIHVNTHTGATREFLFVFFRCIDYHPFQLSVVHGLTAAENLMSTPT